jgi:diguanylate cyclase (GGDEF)-like protein
MDKDYQQNIDVCPCKRVSALLVICLVCAAGLGCTVCALLSPGLEWRILSIGAPAAAMSLFVVEARSRRTDCSISLSLTHCLLFAGVLVLGPLTVALPAALTASIRRIDGRHSRGSLCALLYEIARPAAVCSLASLVYVSTGGSLVAPQQVGSFLPLLGAAAVYVGANALVWAVAPGSSERSAERPRRTISIAAGWSLCIFSGYAAAVLYAIAPSYVLLSLAAPAVLAAAALHTSAGQRTQPLRHEIKDEMKTAHPASMSSKSGLAFVDSVTGLANRRYLDMFLKNELSRSQRAQRPLSVAVFDLDEFKSSPSRKDESAREALIAMGKKLKSEVRDYDMIAAYSSSRLVAVFPDSCAQESEEIVCRLHKSVAGIRLRGKPISVSAGISTFPEHGSTPEDLINASHRALNQGRYLGPNLVHSFRELQKAS